MFMIFSYFYLCFYVRMICLPPRLLASTTQSPGLVAAGPCRTGWGPDLSQVPNPRQGAEYDPAPMARSGRHDDDPAWGDTTARDGKRRRDPAVLHRIREDFWRCCATVDLSVPRWESIPRMHANLKWLLEGGEGRPSIPEDIVRTSFLYYRNEIDSLDLSPATDCWAVYFARKSRYIGQAVAAQAGARAGQPAQTVGDIAVDQRRRRRRIIGRQE